MDLQTRFEQDMKEAMRGKEELRLSVLRMMRTALHNRAIEKRAKGGELTEDEVIMIVRSEASKRRDAADGFMAGGRPELAEKERHELAIIEHYLPQEADDVELSAAVKAVVEELKPAGPKDFGKVMGEVMKRLKGRISGERARVAVMQMLK